MKKTINIHGEEKWVDNITFLATKIRLPAKTFNYVIFNKYIIFMVCSRELLGSALKRNIWCYGLDGEIKWKIEPNPETKDPYVAVQYSEEEDKLLAHIATGYFDLDPDTGKVTNFFYNGGH